MAREIRCTECGAKCFDTDSYCPKCYASISVRDTKNDDMLEGISIENWKQFIADKSADYIEVFRKNENKKIFASFHPWAFLFGTSWMYYRKMYLQAIITLFIEMLIIVIGALLNGPLMLLMLPAAVLLKILIGAFAHCIYRNHIERNLLKSENNIKKGGTSTAAVIIGTIVGSLVITFIIEPLSIIIASIS